MTTGAKLEAVNVYGFFFFFLTVTKICCTVDIYTISLTGTYAAVSNLENKECVCSFTTLCKN